jgi:hypothetical protein
MSVASWHSSSRYDGAFEQYVVDQTPALENGSWRSFAIAHLFLTVIYVVAWQVLLSSSIAFVGLAMAWRVAEEEFAAREVGRANHKNPMRDSNWSSGSTSPSPRPGPLSIDVDTDDGSENNCSEVFDSEVGKNTEDGAEGGRTSKLRLSSMTWSGPSPRSRKPSDLEQSLTPRSQE